MTIEKNFQAMVGQKGWYSELAECRVSPYFDERCQGSDVSLLVLHNISLSIENSAASYLDQLFMGHLAEDKNNKKLRHLLGLRVSTHFVILRDGRCLQYVPTNCRAWYTQQSNYQGETDCNDFAIDIELEKTCSQHYTKKQYATLAKLTRKLQADYPKLKRERIVAYSDLVADDKSQPGYSFNWKYYLNLLNSTEK